MRTFELSYAPEIYVDFSIQAETVEEAEEKAEQIWSGLGFTPSSEAVSVTCYELGSPIEE